MDIQRRIIKFVNGSNWVVFAVVALVGFLFAPRLFAVGILCGGLIVTVNFHLLARTLKKSLNPKTLSSRNVILIKYYIRFVLSGLIIFILISNHFVDPIGLLVGLSVVVISLSLATLVELTKQIFCKEAV